jgi:AdoMet-dependent rRNA methyltransferase SPB1
MSEDEALGNRDLVSDKSGQDGEESENDDDLESESDEGGEAGIFVNPLNKVKKEEGSQESEEWSDDDAEDLGGEEQVDKNGERLKKTLLRKRRRGEVGVAEDFYKNEDIEEVPADDPGTRKEKGYDSEDSQEVAELRLMAKKMLRKKTRDRMIEDSYNRYTFNDEASELPTWFVDEEKKYYRPFINLTKEEIAIEKEQIKAYNCRPSKKVEEAKNRKKKRLTKAMQKIKKKAVVIADQDINEASKMKQIQKLYKKEKAKH